MIFKRRSNGKPGLIKKVSKDYQVNRWIGFSYHKNNIKKLLGVATVNNHDHPNSGESFDQQMQAAGLTNEDIIKKAKQQSMVSIILLSLGIASILYLIYHALRAEYNGLILCIIICIVSLSQAITTGLTAHRLKQRSMKITLGQWLTSLFK